MCALSRVRAVAVWAAMLLVCAYNSHAANPGRDLQLEYRSSIDQTEQPYRLYVPSQYDGQSALPLVVALHGTGGSEASLFEQYGGGRIKDVAEEHGVLLLSPYGRGVTEYYGIGENDIFCVLADVQQRFQVDPDRIYLTGHSMGGTGAARLALQHPDLFAAVAPLSAAYSHPHLAHNARHVPFWWIGGGDDHEFYLKGVRIGAERQILLGCPTKLDILPGRGHGDWVPEYFDQVFSWLLKHERVAHPREYVFAALSPMHGQAYSTAIDKIAKPGTVGKLTVRIEQEGTVHVSTDNVAAFSVLPDLRLLDLKRPLRVLIDGTVKFEGMVTDVQELKCVYKEGAGWTSTVAPRRQIDPTVWRKNPVAESARELRMEGVEAPLANWITDAMRAAAGADIALYNRHAYRGLPIPQGAVDMLDLIQASRPFEQLLVTTELTGAELLTILEANLPDPAAGIREDKLVQVSGMRYSFNRDRPQGSRISSSDLDPRRNYKIVLEGHVPERETLRLAGRFGTLDYRITEVPFLGALYAQALSTGRINAQTEGRVREANQFRKHRFITSDSTAQDMWPCFSADGQTVLFSRTTDRKTWRLQTVATSGGKPRQFPADSPVLGTRANWSWHRPLIAFNGHPPKGQFNLSLIAPDGSDLRQLQFAGISDVMSYPSWYPDGKSMAVVDFSGEGSVIKRIDMATQTIVALTDPKALWAGVPRVSPDGSTIVMGGQENHGQSYSQYRNKIWLLSRDGKLRRLDSKRGWAPVWSPDGKWIAFASDRASDQGRWAIFVASLDGVTIKQITPLELNAAHPTWSADGKLIAFSAQLSAGGNAKGVAVIDAPRP